jgi:L-alanine-DL-glutamate epimerase-like enolase superfamily enzyme
MRRIVSWSLYALTIPYAKPVTWAFSVEAGAPLLVLRLQADDGAIGISEITVKPTWYGISYSSVVAALKDVLLPIATSIDVSDPSSFYAAAATIPENQAAKALIDNALWDMSAFASETPLWKSWGGNRSTSVSWLIARQAPSDMVAEALKTVEKLGITTLKVKGGQGIDTDIGILKDIRKAVGYDIRVYVDPNWHYELDTCLDYISRMSELGVIAVEDPYRLCPDRAFEALQSSIDIPILVDFFASSLCEVRSFADRGMRALSLKPSRIGITECLLQAAFAKQNGIQAHVGFGGESQVGTLIALQLAASLFCRTTWLPAECSFFVNMNDGLLFDNLVIVDGRIEIPAMASVSELLDHDKLQRMSHMQVDG